MKIRLSRCVVLGMTFLLMALAVGGPAQAQEILAFSDFRQVTVESGMQVEIREGNAFRVEVDGAPENLDRLRVEREGDRLRFSMAREGWFWWWRLGTGDRDIDIRIEMPELTALSLSGGSRGVVHMDGPTDRVRVSLSGGSRLDGTFQTGSVDLSLSGGSRATLAGRTEVLGFSASGGGRIDAAALTSGRVQARMSGGAQAVVSTDGAIDASLSGGAQLRYHGAAALGSISTSGGSRVRPES